MALIGPHSIRGTSRSPRRTPLSCRIMASLLQATGSFRVEPRQLRGVQETDGGNQPRFSYYLVL